LQIVLKELIDLLGEEDVGDSDLFLEPRDIEEGILSKIPFRTRTGRSPGDGEARG